MSIFTHIYIYPVTILFQYCKMRFVKEAGTAHATVIVEDKGLSSNCWKVGEQKKMWEFSSRWSGESW